MGFSTGKEYYGFKLLSKEYVKDVKSDAYIFEHIKTKAKVFALKNNDNNKSFSIGFRTPPIDSTGVAHILEHSVLCGSRKFPLKDSFAELIKGSLQTFINAFTFPDKTIYPFSTRNKKDYFNLMDVYFDAVLYPLIAEDAFKQEGWHYELNSIDEDITYKGVVYNEMKGFFSSPKESLYRYLQNSLFPDTTYGVESGGAPKNIPDLTYEDFKVFHSKYYHPSNSYIYFYGDAPLEEELQFAQENYLKDFSSISIDSHIGYQKPFSKLKVIKKYYPITKGESIEKKSMMAIANVIGNFDDIETSIATEVLVNALYKSDASPLRKALIKSNIAEDITPIMEKDIIQIYAGIILQSTDEKHEKTFQKIYNETIEQIIKDGIDKDLLTSSFNQWEFALREEKNDPLRGLEYCLQAFNYWLYDKSPVEALKTEDSLNTVKSKIKEQGYFEGILKKYFLNNPHKTLVKLIPDNTLSEKMENEEKEKLKKYKESLNKNQLEKLIEETKELKRLQELANSKENLAKLPKLAIKDVPPTVEKIPTEVISEKPLILYHDIPTNKIAYLDLYFSTEGLNVEELAYLSVFGNLLIGVGTNKTPYDELIKKINMYTGRIGTKFKVFEKFKEMAKSYFIVCSRVISDNYKYLSDILEELISEMSLKNLERIKELLNMEKVKIENQLMNSSYLFVIKRLSAYTTNTGKEEELVNGLEYYKTLLKTIEELNNEPDKFKKKIMSIKEKLFTKDNLMVNIVSDKDVKPNALKIVENIKNILSDKNIIPQNKKYKEFNFNQAFASSSQVQYVGKGINIYEKGLKYSGTFELMRLYLGTSYLWDKVRLMGGAYGCFTNFNKNTGQFSIISYRDPNLVDTYKIYNEISKHLKELELDNEEFTRLIISSANEPLLSPYSKGEVAIRDYIEGFTYEDRKKRKKEILSSSLEHLKSYSSFFELFSKDGYLCTFGNEDKINKNKELFSEIIKVMK